MSDGCPALRQLRQQTLYVTPFRLQLILFFGFLFGTHFPSLHLLPSKGSTFTNVCSKVFPAVSMILIGYASLPPALISSSFACIFILSSEPGVGGTKMHDFQKGPSQLLFFLFFSSQRADSFQPLGRYMGLVPSLSAFKILSNPLRPEFRISSLKASLYPEFFNSCMKLSKCFLFVLQESSLLQFSSLRISS